MDKLKTLLGTAGVALVVSVVVVLFAGGETTREIVREVSNGNLGAVSSPDISSPYFSFGGVRHWAGRTAALNSASTTICAIQSPAATSSLRFASVNLEVSSTTATVLTLARSASPSASTTLIESQSIAAGSKATLTVGSSTQFAPNSYINASLKGGSGTFSPTGVCTAVWTEV